MVRLPSVGGGATCGGCATRPVNVVASYLEALGITGCGTPGTAACLSGACSPGACWRRWPSNTPHISAAASRDAAGTPRSPAPPRPLDAGMLVECAPQGQNGWRGMPHFAERVAVPIDAGRHRRCAPEHAVLPCGPIASLASGVSASRRADVGETGGLSGCGELPDVWSLVW